MTLLYILPIKPSFPLFKQRGNRPIHQPTDRPSDAPSFRNERTYLKAGYSVSGTRGATASKKKKFWNPYNIASQNARNSWPNSNMLIVFSHSGPYKNVPKKTAQKCCFSPF